MEQFQIRKIEKADDSAIAAVIRSVLSEHNVPKVGTAFADPQLDFMSNAYNQPRAAYFLAVSNQKIVGGAGIAPLEGEAEELCELQKMYFLPEARGRGLGSAMMRTCLEFAKSAGFRKCYLETMPYMTAAQALYKKSGFHYLEKPMGNTGHSACPVWMLCEL